MVNLNSEWIRISLYGYQSETEYENVFAVLDIQTYIVYSWYIRDENISNNSIRNHIVGIKFCNRCQYLIDKGELCYLMIHQK